MAAVMVGHGRRSFANFVSFSSKRSNSPRHFMSRKSLKTYPIRLNDRSYPVRAMLGYGTNWSTLCCSKLGQSSGVTTMAITTNRHMSTAASVVEDAAVSSVDLSSDYIPPPPAISDVMSDDLVTERAVNALGEPTIASLGLGSWSPPGMYQTMLEGLHVSTGLPWWAAIVLSTFVIRVCVFPLVIISQKNAAHMHNHMPTLTKLQERFQNARSGGNQMETMRAGQELNSFMKRNKLQPFKSAVVPMAQIPIFLSVFWGLRAMAELPVESLKTGGLLWFTDLTLTDPYYALPVITMSTLFVTLEVGSEGVRSSQLGHTARWVMRGLPIVMFPFVANFPTAMCCYWMTSNVFSLTQVSILKIPRVRNYFNIEEMVKHPESVLRRKKFAEGFKDNWRNSKLMNELDQKSRQDALRFKEAGTGPLIKTFSQDPTDKTAKISAKSR